MCYNCGQLGHVTKSCPEKGKGKKRKGESQGEHKEKEKGKIGKGWQSINEWAEWDQTDKYTSVPILSMSCGEKQPETESPDLKITSVKSTCIKTRAGNRQFVCNTKFVAIAEKSRDKKKNTGQKSSEV